ncbi:hypothetical protein PG994_007181 [Apiospora phragmitis]|uniref:Uncharacterized protein n=1 Tax=Apiospora phragmitis TaxID=2905665 RepID=A0ABR1V024_9PEZI
MARPRCEGLWSKWILLPCWMIQMGGSIVFGIAGAILLIGAAYADQIDQSSSEFYGYSLEDMAQLVRVTGAVTLAFAAMTFVFCVAEIVLYATHILNPVVVLVFACLKALAWAVMVILNVATAARGAEFPWLNFILSVMLLAAACVQLIFGARYTHHQRHQHLASHDRGHYEKAGGPAGGVVEAGFHHPGNYTLVSGPKQQLQQRDTEYRSPSPEDLGRDDAAAPLYSNQDGAGLEARSPPPSYR